MRQNKLEQIGILGCGWLGKALAVKLIQNDYKIKGTTTNSNKIDKLKEIGVKPYKIHLASNSLTGDIKKFLKDIDILVIAIPPQFKKSENNLLKALSCMFRQYDLSFLRKLIYVSSTGVFADGIDNTYSEYDCPNNISPRGKHLIDIENLIKRQNTIQNRSIIRYGGLIKQGGRNPVHYLSGKNNIPNPQAPINLIEQRDAVTLIIKIIEQSTCFKIYHGVNPSHPSRKDYYIKKAKQLNLKPPHFDESKTSLGKKIDSEITQKKLIFVFKSSL